MGTLRMSGMVTISVDRAAFDASVSRLLSLGRDASKQLATVSRIMEEEVRNTFRNEADPWGHPWPPHAPSTVKARERKGNTRTSLLVDTGAMYDSIERSSDATSAQVSMDGPAEVHQFGTTTAGRSHNVTIPARPMFPTDEPPDAWRDRVSEPFVSAFEAAA
jgi:phage virion morphogenesis protein